MNSRSAWDASAIDLATVCDTNYENDKFFVDHVVDDAGVADTNTHLTCAALELLAPRRARVFREVIDGLKDAPRNGTVELAQCFERCLRVGDLVLHGRRLQTELRHHVRVRCARLGLVASGRCCADVSLIFQRF